MKQVEVKLKYENGHEDIPVMVRRAGAYEVRQHGFRLTFCDLLAAFGAGSLVCIVVWVALGM